MYHVMSRGNCRQDIFLSEVDLRDFLKALAEARRKTGWRAHAWVGRNWTWPDGASASPASWG
jgi:REP element-mobilizing transposase RayT